ncbi:MAG: GGDEF domain-containing protein [Actinomycetota bacterium]
MTSESEQQLLQFMYLAPVGLVEAHRDGSVINLNPLATQTMILLSGNPDLSNAFTSFEGAFPDLRELVDAKDGRGVVMENARFEHDARAGDTRNFSLSVHIIADDRIGFVINDITTLVAQEREIRRREVELRTIVDSVHTHMIVSVDADGCVQSHNASIERLTGCGPDIVGQSISEFFLADLDLDSLTEGAQANGWVEAGADMIGPDNTRWWGAAVYTHIVDEMERTAGYALVVREDTERHEREEQLTKWATEDTLTGLSTRRAFEDGLDDAVAAAEAKSQPIAFVLMDIDHFKSVNDTHGHQAGDDVLVELAERLRGVVRPHDLVVRMGGEEFGVLLVGVDVEQAERIAERIRSTVASTPFDTSVGPLDITISGGVCQWRHGQSKFSTVYKQADDALYEAKETGRNRFILT